MSCDLILCALLPLSTPSTAAYIPCTQNHHVSAQIFVKNIHFFATLLDVVAKELDVEVGEYTHWITNLCYDRDATSC